MKNKFLPLLVLLILIALAGNVFADTLYENWTGNNTNENFYAQYWRGQTFTPSVSHELTAVQLYMMEDGTPADLNVSITGVDGSGDPDLSNILCDVNIPETEFSAVAFEWEDANLSGCGSLSAGTTYGIVLYGGLNGSNQYRWGLDTVAPVYGSGEFCSSTDSGATWSCDATKTVNFKEYGISLGITSDFDYTVNEDLVNYNWDIDLNDTTTATGYDVNEWEWYIDGASVSTDQNYYFADANVGDYNTCLVATGYPTGGGSALDDWNCQTISNNYSYLELHFYNEDTNAVVTPTLTRNGSTVTVTDGNYFESFDENTTSGTLTFIATGTGYHERQWQFDVNAFSDIQVDLYLLETDDGVDIEFRFYDTDETTELANVMVTAYLDGNPSDGNYCERQRTDASGDITFFLQNDANYYFYIEKASGSDIYEPVGVDVLIPKEETALYNITPFDIYVGGLAVQSYTGLTATQSFNIYGNTKEYYSVTVDANDEYYERTYVFQVLGDTADYTLQPYLADVNDAILSYLYVYNYLTRTTVEGVRIDVNKNIPGEGVVPIQSVETDSAGVTLVSFVTLDEYTLDFYYDNEWIYTATLVPVLTSYDVFLNISDATYDPSESEDLNVIFSPEDGFIERVGANFTLSQTIQSTTTISSLNIHVTQDGVELHDVNGTSVTTATYSNNYAFSSVDSNALIIIEVTMIINGREYVSAMSYGVEDSSPYNLWDTLQDVKDEELGDIGAILVSLIIAIIICGFVASHGIKDLSILGFIAAIILGLFTYIGWIPLWLFGIACMAGAGAYLIMQKGGS